MVWEELSVCPQRGPTALKESRPPRAGTAGPHKSFHNSLTRPASRLPPVLTPLPIRMQRGRQPSQRRIQLPHSPLSHRPDSTIRETEPSSPAYWQPRAPSWEIQWPLVPLNTAARGEGEAPSGRKLAPRGPLKVASWRPPLLPEGRGCARGKRAPPTPRAGLVQASLCSYASPKERRPARQLSVWLRPAAVPLDWVPAQLLVTPGSSAAQPGPSCPALPCIWGGPPALGL